MHWVGLDMLHHNHLGSSHVFLDADASLISSVGGQGFHKYLDIAGFTTSIVIIIIVIVTITITVVFIVVIIIINSIIFL